EGEGEREVQSEGLDLEEPPELPRGTALPGGVGGHGFGRPSSRARTGSSFIARSAAATAPGSERISSGHGRGNPSSGRLRVASIPTFAPRFGTGFEIDSWSTGPCESSKSRPGSACNPTR